MKKKYIFIIILLFSCTLFVTKGYSQQDSQFTQYMYNTETINPAYTGTRGVLSFTGLFRTQWVGLDGAPKTATFSASSPLSEHVGLGLSFIQDEIGPSEESTITADFSYTISMTDKVAIAFGIKAGINLLNIDYSLLNINPDNVFQFNIDNRVTPLIGVGAYLFNNTWYAGLSVPNLLETTHYDDSATSNASEKPNLYAIGGYVFNLNEYLKFKPAVLGKFTSNAPAAIDISANFLFYEKFTIGAAYRVDAAVSILAAFQISNTILIGYAYDFETTYLGNYNPGSHEIVFRFDVFNSANKIVSPRFF